MSVKWIVPDKKTLKREYMVEVEFKGMEYLFDGVRDFLDRISDGEIMKLSKSVDRKIAYRSHTKTYESLVGLLQSYRSWPEFRNYNTVDNLYNIMENGGTMDMPLVLRGPSGRMRVLAGNTRLDVAFQVGITPKILIIDIDTNL